MAAHTRRLLPACIRGVPGSVLGQVKDYADYNISRGLFPPTVGANVGTALRTGQARFYLTQPAVSAAPNATVLAPSSRLNCRSVDIALSNNPRSITPNHYGR
jgi:hypothetical protein